MSDSMRGVWVGVYREAGRANDPSNKRISSRHSHLTLIGREIKWHDEPRPDMPAVKLCLKGDYFYAEPMEPVPKGHIGYFFGGNYIYAYESTGFPSKYPIPVHDIYETEKVFDSQWRGGQ